MSLRIRDAGAGDAAAPRPLLAEFGHPAVPGDAAHRSGALLGPARDAVLVAEPG